MRERLGCHGLGLSDAKRPGDTLCMDEFSPLLDRIKASKDSPERQQKQPFTYAIYGQSKHRHG
ncbi:hypothetical protein PSEUDO8O_50321 [Pseudomonas sp. 8O]|nr:hypothetical protein PSEUDO8O_50321 [Pseudomonas sp. 8O]